ncbi:MAG: tRNA lysidine(34) synthetase TilS [Muribaculaceae bacterium]|nr:tRNA lysidine(34) synthetase TilS [Muribaculaceae bacterium]
MGHHCEDSRETFFLNLLRGTGVRGLAGIPPRRGIYVRPLLDATRGMIEDYLMGLGLTWVTDSTNLEDDFRRNRVRLSLLPEIERLFPGALGQIDKTVANVRADSDLLAELVRRQAAEWRCGPGWHVGRVLAGNRCGGALLRHLLDGFHPDVVTQVAVAARAGESGRVFSDRGGGRWLLDRGVLLPYAGDDIVAECHTEFRLDEPATHPGCLKIEKLPRECFAPVRDAAVMWLDAAIDGRAQPLTWRSPRLGDRIEPFGMRGSRLLSDIYTDSHLSVADKRAQRVLAIGDTILWAAGLRASRHFSVGDSTAAVYKITLRQD